MKNRTVKRCIKCALPATYPGIKFNRDNVCNYCIYFDMYKKREKTVKNILKKEFVKVVIESKKGKNKYDGIVAFSGGKDSTFLLHYLKAKFGLNILAHTLDNGFISEKALENIKKVVKTLNIDHRLTRPDFGVCKDVFVHALRGRIHYPKEILAMMSSTCAACLGMVFGSTIKLAIKLKIPLMFIGFTPGQYPAISLENFSKVGSCVFLSKKAYKDDPLDVLKILRDPIDEMFGEKVEKYFFKSQYIDKNLKTPVILFPFHTLLDYDEKVILKEISKLGWERPRDTDSCSTNCLLNTLAIYSCVKQMGYHPYIGELSSLVRERKISYEDAVEAEKIDENSFAMRHSLSKLNLTKADI